MERAERQELNEAIERIATRARQQGVCPMFLIYQGQLSIDLDMLEFNRRQAIKAQAARGGRYIPPPKYADMGFGNKS